MKLKGNNLFEHIRVKVSLIEQSHVLDLIPAVAYPQLAYPPLLLNIRLEAQLKWVIFMAGTPPKACPSLKHGASELVTF